MVAKGKKNGKGKKGGAAAGSGARKRRNRASVVDDGTGRVIAHADMIMDPCNSLIKPTAYRGNDGFVQRFSRVSVESNATLTAFAILFYPGYNSMVVVNAATPDTAISTAWNTAGPGQAYLLGNAGSQRAVGACLTWDYVGTELNRQGTIVMGSIKVGSLGTATTVNQLQALLSTGMRTPDHSVEQKWCPAPSDEEYWATGPTAPENASDSNMIVIAGSGFAAGVAYRIKTTLIAEWMPKQGLGVAAVNASSPDAPAGLERVRTLLHSFGEGWQSAMHTGAVVARTARQVYNSTRAAGQVLSIMAA